MPTYLYLCEVNNIEFEDFHSIKIQLEECPICKERKMELHKPKMLIYGGSGKGIVELSGDEVVKKAREDAQKFKKEVYSSEKHYANVLGEGNYHNLQTRMDRRGK